MPRHPSPACLNCSRRHSKCDRGVPSCGSCIVLDRSCTYPSSNSSSEGGSTSQHTTPSTTPPTPVGRRTLRKAKRYTSRLASQALALPPDPILDARSQQEEESHPANLSLRVGIDFGTTYSAVSFIREHIQLRDGIPHAIGDISLSKLCTVRDGHESQFPCEVAYSTHRNRLLWGREVEKDVELPESSRIGFLKLGLDNTSRTASIRAKLNQQLLAIDSTADELIAKYLESIWKLAKCKIKERCLLKSKDDPFEWDVEVALAVPAIWEQHAVDRMLNAASIANIPNVSIVSEPESAAHLLLRREVEQSGPFGLKSWLGEAFCVVDMVCETSLRNSHSTIHPPSYHNADSVAYIGGGTVDLITYSIVSLNPLTFKEEVMGSGGLYGSAYINHTFREYLTTRFHGCWEFIKDCTNQTQEEFLSMATRIFEIQKRDFNGFDAEYGDTVIWISALRPWPAVEIQNGRFTLTRADMIKIFEPTVNGIIGLQRDQIESFHAMFSTTSRRIRHIAPVGGLSAIPHVREAMDRAFASGPNPVAGYPIPLLDPLEESSTLISHGAILAALNKSTMTSRYLTQSFGVAWDEEYVRSIHGNSFNLDVHSNKKVARDRCVWILRRGQAYPQVYTGTIRGERDLWVNEPYLIDERIYCSHTHTTDHLYVHDTSNDIFEYCCLEFAFSDKDFVGFPEGEHPITKRRYYHVEYEVRFNLDGKMLTYECIIPSHGIFPSKTSHGDNPIRKAGKSDIHRAFARVEHL